MDALLFLGGVVCLLLQPVLPHGGDAVLLACAVAAVCVHLPPRAWLAIAFPLGFAWAWLAADERIERWLPAAFEQTPLFVEGHIAGLPQPGEYGLRFDFDVTRLTDANDALRHDPQRIRLTWPDPAPGLVPGEAWRLPVKLKRPHALANPGASDGERALFSAGIGASGSVRTDARPTRIPGDDRRYDIDRARLWFKGRMTERIADPRRRAVLIALVIGDQAAVPAADWERFALTGTTHLMAISGLHIGVVAAAAFFIVRHGWGFLPRLARRIAPLRMGSAAALLAALGYSLLAGFSVPTQRTFAMIGVALVASTLLRATGIARVLAIALVVVLSIDPLAALSTGFWLSFGACAAIGLVLGGRLRRAGLMREFLATQWAVTLALTPPLIFLFGQMSLVAPLANLFAVPWITLLTVPAGLLGALCLPASDVLARFFLGLADATLVPALAVLDALAVWPWASHAAGSAPVWTQVLAFTGALLLLAPWRFGWTLPAAFLCLPLFIDEPQRPAHGALRVDVLDVGQGLAVVLRTRRHTLVFDTGPRIGATDDAARRVLIPFLRQAGVMRADRLIVSHGDQDHAGGFESLRARLPVHRIFAAVPRLVAAGVAEPCQAGEAWDWDGVRFEVLHPEAHAHWKENDGSCVLRVATTGASILLPADIEAAAERDLVRRHGESLASDVLILPHHGSATSSTPVFLRAVAAHLAVVPAGYRNRFGFPKALVTKRLDALDVAWFQTGEEGAIALDLAADGAITVATFRRAHPRLWRQAP